MKSLGVPRVQSDVGPGLAGERTENYFASWDCRLWYTGNPGFPSDYTDETRCFQYIPTLQKPKVGRQCPVEPERQLAIWFFHRANQPCRFPPPPPHWEPPRQPRLKPIIYTDYAFLRIGFLLFYSSTHGIAVPKPAEDRQPHHRRQILAVG